MNAATRWTAVAAGFAATGVIGYLHHLGGLVYEFHVFFLLPAAFVTWFVGWRPGATVAFAAVLAWGVIDWQLGGAQGGGPLLFNSTMRLGVFLLVAWLLARLRAALAREAELARRDPLTGLPNRRMFYAEGELALAQARRRREPLTAMFVDIDDFKRVNDTLGHQAGDALLRAVAEVLGGDEFALLLPGMAGEAAAAHAEKLRRALQERMTAQHWPVSFSVGLACFPSPPPSIDAVVTRADALMYEAKRGGKNAIRQETADDPAPRTGTDR